MIINLKEIFKKVLLKKKRPAPKIQKGIVKHQMNDVDRRRIFEEQKREARENREKMKIEINGCDAREALVNFDHQPQNHLHIANHKISEAERLDFARQQRREARANREKQRGDAFKIGALFGGGLNKSPQKPLPKRFQNRKLGIQKMF
jgi:hypothetical protein